MSDAPLFTADDAGSHRQLQLGAKIHHLGIDDDPLHVTLQIQHVPQEDTERYTPMVTRLLQLVVIDILAIGLALRMGETASLQLEKSKRSIHTKRLEHEKEDS